MGGIPCRLFFACCRPSHGRCPRLFQTVLPLPFTRHLEESEVVVKRGTRGSGGEISRGRCPSFEDKSTFLQITREREWENRLKKSWTPTMVWSATGKKKAAGNAAHQQGDECVEGAGVPATPPSLTSLQCCGRRLRTAKKRGCSLSTPAFDASPLHRRSIQMMT